MSDELRVRLESVQNELATRRSIALLAQSAIAAVAALILGGSSYALSRDLPQLAVHQLVALPALAAAVFSVVRYAQGQRLRQRERERFELLKSLRAALKLDDPAALLPE